MSISTLASRNGTKGQTLRKQYKEVISGYRRWEQLGHAEEYLLFPDNIRSLSFYPTIGIGVAEN